MILTEENATCIRYKLCFQVMITSFCCSEISTTHKTTEPWCSEQQQLVDAAPDCIGRRNSGSAANAGVRGGRWQCSTASAPLNGMYTTVASHPSDLKYPKQQLQANEGLQRSTSTGEESSMGDEDSLTFRMTAGPFLLYSCMKEILATCIGQNTHHI